MFSVTHWTLLDSADQGRLSEGECDSEPGREGKVEGLERGGGAQLQGHSQAVKRARKGAVAPG